MLNNKLSLSTGSRDIPSEGGDLPALASAAGNHPPSISNRPVIAVVLCAFLAACGGGGGGGNGDGGSNDPGTDLTDDAPSGELSGFVINVTDNPGEGLNDTTSATPVGGNTGTTVGEQRLIVVREAARVWAEALDINTDIVLSIHFDELECSALSGVVGAAGPVEAFRAFAGSPSATTWYVSALANNLAGSDQSPGVADIEAQFNSRVGDADCLGGAQYYYGLDGNGGSHQIDLFHIVLHELAHGLGFVSLLDVQTGALFNNQADTFTANLRDGNFTPYPQLSDAQRSESITSQALWGGTVVGTAMETLQCCTVETGSGNGVPMYTPFTVDEGSSLSHWNDNLFPSELMEPNTGATTIHQLSALDIGSMMDLGWPLDQGADQDGDGLSNVWEVQNGLDPRNPDNANEDLDGDTLTNAQEFSYGTAANRADTDGDGLSDPDELNVYNTDPTKTDTDDNGIPDNEEI